MSKQQPTQGKDQPASIINVEAMVSATTKEPHVIIHWGDQQGELTPQEARQHALAILECAEAAETDALVFKWARSIAPDVSESLAADILKMLRAYRDAVNLANAHKTVGIQLAELDEVRRLIRDHIENCNDAMCAGESVPDFSALEVWLKKY